MTHQLGSFACFAVLLRPRNDKARMTKPVRPLRHSGFDLRASLVIGGSFGIRHSRAAGPTPVRVVTLERRCDSRGDPLPCFLRNCRSRNGVAPFFELAFPPAMEPSRAVPVKTEEPHGHPAHLPRVPGRV